MSDVTEQLGQSDVHKEKPQTDSAPVPGRQKERNVALDKYLLPQRRRLE